MGLGVQEKISPSTVPSMHKGARSRGIQENIKNVTSYLGDNIRMPDLG